MALSLEQLKAAFKSPERTERQPNNYYPFWNMDTGKQAVIRFLPDGNKDNPLGFLVEKSTHQLMVNGEKKSVPCLKMYGDQDCPVCKVSAAYYKKEDKVNGKKYWRKKQYIAQAIVMEDPLPPNDQGETHVGKVRFLAVGHSLYKIIKDAFESGELDEIPYAYKNGTDFIIKKDKQGEYASYNLSKFARKATNVDADLLASLTLTDLSTLLPKNPGREKIEQMLEADLTGTAYKASGSEGSDDEGEESGDESDVPSTPVAQARPAPAAASKSDEPALSDADADAVLAKIRARRGKQA